MILAVSHGFFLMKSKFEVRVHLQAFITHVETQFGTKIQIIRSNNGLEFSMEFFYKSKGIIHQTSCIEMPQQNGTVDVSINIF